MNAVPPEVIDFWVAHRSIVQEEKESKGNKMDPETLYKRLSHGAV